VLLVCFAPPALLPLLCCSIGPHVVFTLMFLDALNVWQKANGL
jgi:hypothetical protein